MTKENMPVDTRLAEGEQRFKMASITVSLSVTTYQKASELFMTLPNLSPKKIQTYSNALVKMDPHIKKAINIVKSAAEFFKVNNELTTDNVMELLAHTTKLNSSITSSEKTTEDIHTVISKLESEKT